MERRPPGKPQRGDIVEIVEEGARHEFHTVPPAKRQATLAGMPPADAARLQLEAERLRADAAERHAEELLAKLARPPVPLLSLPPSRSAWAKRGYQALGALILLMGAGTAYLTLRNTAQEPRINSTITRQDVQETNTNTVEDRVTALEQYARGLAKHSDCVDAQRDSAIERSTGHVIEGDHDVEWKPQNKPALKLRILWGPPTWSVETACPEKPNPPKTASKKPAP